MGDLDVTRRDAARWDRYATPDDVHQANAANRVAASGLLPKELSSQPSEVAGTPLVLSSDAFANPALTGRVSTAPVRQPSTPCDQAAPTRIVVPPGPRGAPELPGDVSFGCTKPGDLCLTQEEQDQIQAARQGICLATGVDPLRFEKVDPRNEEIRFDRTSIADAHAQASLANLELMIQSPLAAAVYGPARVAGVREETAQRAAMGAALVGDVAMAAIAVHGARQGTATPRSSATPAIPAQERSVVELSPAIERSGDAGTIRKVNVGLPIGNTPGGRFENCANCCVATDAMLAGHPASALPGNVTHAVDLAKVYGNRPWVAMRGTGGIEAHMALAGPGSRGIVLGERNGIPGHFFNVVNQGGTIRFLDGQTGKPAKLNDGFVRFWLLRTN